MLSACTNNSSKQVNPFGMEMKTYSADSGGYRYGFNGMEKDDETYGQGNALDFGARIYDSRLGRWLSRDPLEKKYPAFSPYNYCSNNPIGYKDIDGRDFVIAISQNEDGKTVFTVITTIHVNDAAAKIEVDNALALWNNRSAEKGDYVLKFNVKSQIDQSVVSSADASPCVVFSPRCLYC